jgi:peptidoglycan/LPS O-acetylase OafA/YrhL
MSKMKSNNYLNQYCPSIDGMRTVAVLAVIICHFNKELLSSGYLGVDVFFVISGFVITASMLKRDAEKPLYRFKSFYKRRIKRLFPALSVVVAVAGLLICFFVRDAREYLKTGLSSLAGFSNIFLYFKSVDYWGMDASLNPFTHTWSLGVEEQFYFVYPIILIWVTKSGISISALRRLAQIMGALSLLSLTSFILLHAEHPAATYFMMPFRLWEMGLGSLIYLLLRLSNGKARHLLLQIPSIGTLAVLVVLLCLPKEWGLFIPVLVPFLTAMLIAQLVCQGSAAKTWASRILERPFILYLGKISYSLYLWHWVILVIARWTVGVTLYSAPALVLSTFILSVITHEFVESRMRTAKWSLSPRSILTFAPVAIFLIFIAGLKVGIFDMKNVFLGAQKAKVDVTINDIKAVEGGISFSRIRTLGNSHSLHILPMLNEIGMSLGIEILSHKGPDYISIPSGDRSDLLKLDSVLSPLDKGDLLIISNRNYLLYEQPFIHGSGDRYTDMSAEKELSGSGLQVWLSELDEVIDKSRQKGLNVVLFLPLPEFNQPVLHPELYQKEWFRAVGISQPAEVSAEFLASRFSSEFFDSVQLRALENENFYVFDPMPYLHEEGGDFNLVVQGFVAYNDTHHLSSEGALLLLNPFFSFLVKNEIL